MGKAYFEWDTDKESINIIKHQVSFSMAERAFHDPHRIIVRDLKHSEGEDRYYCFGKVEEGIITVRFTFRSDVIRIIGAGFWRKGRDYYEEKNSVHR